MVDADGSGQETVLSYQETVSVRITFVFSFLLEIVILFPVFFIYNGILFYMAIFFSNFVKTHSFLELYKALIYIRIIWRIDSSRQTLAFVQNEYKNRWGRNDCNC